MAASRVFYTGILKTVKWEISKRLLCCFHTQSQAAKDSLHVYSRVLPNILINLSGLHHLSSECKRHNALFAPGRTKSSQLLSVKTYSKQFFDSISSKSSSNNLQNESSTDLRKNTHSHILEVEPKLNHVDNQGHAQMVDVADKKESSRLAVATAMVYLGQEAFHLVKENKIRKGDVLTVSQLAGIMASKQTPNLIPLCHNIHITHAEVNLELDEENFAVQITGSVNSVGRTGVEMESLTAVTVAALTVYDMCKAVSHGIVISDIMLLKKVGGKSGDYVAS